MSEIEPLAPLIYLPKLEAETDPLNNLTFFSFKGLPISCLRFKEVREFLPTEVRNIVP